MIAVKTCSAWADTVKQFESVLIYIFTSSVELSRCSTTSPTLILSACFSFGVCVVVTHCDFSCAYFYMFIGHLLTLFSILLEKNVIWYVAGWTGCNISFFTWPFLLRSVCGCAYSIAVTGYGANVWICPETHLDCFHFLNIYKIILSF